MGEDVPQVVVRIPSRKKGRLSETYQTENIKIPLPLNRDRDDTPINPKSYSSKCKRIKERRLERKIKVVAAAATAELAAPRPLRCPKGYDRHRTLGTPEWDALYPEEQLAIMEATKGYAKVTYRTAGIQSGRILPPDTCVVPDLVELGFTRHCKPAPGELPEPEPPRIPQLSVTPEQLRIAVAQLCRVSFADFVKQFWHTIITEPLVWNWHMEFLCSELQASAERVFAGEACPYDLIVNIPPGTSKSTIASVMYRAWIWARMPHAQFIATSHNSDLAMDLSAKARKVIRSPKYMRLFPEIVICKNADNKSYWENTLGGWSMSVGMGSSPIGKHAHFIIVDDPIDPKSAGSDSAKLAAANDFITNTLTSRKLLGGIAFMVMIQQRLAQNDPTGYMLDLVKAKPESIRHFCIPAEDSEHVKPAELRANYVDGLLDPVRLPRAELEDKALRLGEYGYAGQYLQNPIPKGGGLFKVDKMKVVQPPSTGGWLSIVRYWDKAISTKKSGCYTVGALMGKRLDAISGLPRYWVLDVVRGRWGAAEREQKILDTANEDALNYGKMAVLIGLESEPGSSGTVDAEYTTRMLAGFRVDAQKASGEKTVRANPLATQLNIGAVHMAQGNWNAEFLKEFEFFPYSKYKDQVDATAGAFNLLEAQKREVWAF